MRKAERFTGVMVVTWAILDNHFHLLLHVPDKEEAADLSEEGFWERLGALYSKDHDRLQNRFQILDTQI